ncbi:hypothetical protein GQ600_6322 [Phytophthora cactorum]|nr:hypothetical protein GQ600_6322 [Phytophthora cactorum]
MADIRPLEKSQQLSQGGSSPHEAVSTPSRILSTKAAVQTPRHRIQQPCDPSTLSQTPLHRSPSRAQTPYHTPLRRSSRARPPVSHASLVEISAQRHEKEEDLEYIGDGVDGDETFPHWDEYLLKYVTAMKLETLSRLQTLIQPIMDGNLSRFHSLHKRRILNLTAPTSHRK